MGIGGNIKRLRLLNGMDQKTLGDLLHVSNRTVSSWERDRTEPNMGMISRLSQIFGCTKTDLIEQSSDPDLPDLGNEPIEFKITDQEGKLIAAYRVAPDELKKAVDMLLKYGEK